MAAKRKSTKKSITKRVVSKLKQTAAAYAAAKLRRQEVKYAKQLISALKKNPQGGNGKAMIKNEKGNVQIVDLKSKEEAIALLERVVKGEIHLVG